MSAPIPPFPKGSFTRTKQIPNTTTTYLLTDDPSLIDFPALSAAFTSPLVWWATTPSTPSQLQALVQNSYSFGLYHITDNSTAKTMVGFARLITDYVTFAYLTDVYVLKEHQGLGLGNFMMEGVKDACAGWPDFRRGLLITNGGSGAEKVYRRVFGAIDIRERPRVDGEGELIAMEWKNKKAEV